MAHSLRDHWPPPPTSPPATGRSSAPTAPSTRSPAPPTAGSPSFQQLAPTWDAPSPGTTPSRAGTAPATAPASHPTAASSTAPRSTRSSRTHSPPRPHRQADGVGGADRLDRDRRRRAAPVPAVVETRRPSTTGRNTLGTAPLPRRHRSHRAHPLDPVHRNR